MGNSKNDDFFVSARKPRAQDRSLYEINEDLSTELTPQSRKRTVCRGALIMVLLQLSALIAMSLQYSSTLYVAPFESVVSHQWLEPSRH